MESRPSIPRQRTDGSTVRETRVVVDCVCGRTHRLRNVGVYKKVIQAFIDGELIRVTGEGVAIDCIMTILKNADEIGAQ